MAYCQPLPNQGPDSTVFRSRLRKEKIAARMAMSDAEHALASAAIEARLESLLGSKPPQVIAFCWPVRKEFDARTLIERLLARGWQAVQPVVTETAAPMSFRPWTTATPMTEDRHGIPIPVDADKASAPPDIVLLPLVAFDADGYRLGYGGGYFDRTLAAMASRPLKIGIGFELARVASVRPQAHDVRLDIIISESSALLLT